jgi:hypothetical protein
VQHEGVGRWGLSPAGPSGEVCALRRRGVCSSGIELIYLLAILIRCAGSRPGKSSWLRVFGWDVPFVVVLLFRCLDFSLVL